MIRLDTIFKTQNRLHISSALAASYDPKRNYIYRYEQRGRGMFPITLTKSTPVLLTDSEGKVQTTHVPILPATTLRGVLRRTAASIIEDTFLNAGTTISHDLYQAMHCGAVQRNLSGTPLSYDEMVATMSNIFFGIFGGGSRMTPSRLRVQDAYPCVAVLAEQNIAPYLPRNLLLPINEPNGIRSLTMVDHIVRRDDLIVGKDPRAPKIIQNYAEAYARLVGDTMKRREEKKAPSESPESDANESDDDVRASLGTLVYTEFVVPGVPFFVRLQMDEYTTAQAGLLFMALQKLAINGQIGGKKATGAGHFACVWGSFTVDDASYPITIIATDSSQVIVFPDVAQEMIEEAQEVLNKLSPAELESVI